MKVFINSLMNAGKYFYAIPFIVFGSFHFIGTKDMATGLLGDGVFNIVIVIISGLALILAGISIIIGESSRLATLLLALLLFLFIVFIHIPGLINAADDMFMQMSMTALLKDFALMGAALFYAKTLN